MVVFELKVFIDQENTPHDAKQAMTIKLFSDFAIGIWQQSEWQIQIIFESFIASQARSLEVLLPAE